MTKQTNSNTDQSHSPNLGAEFADLRAMYLGFCDTKELRAWGRDAEAERVTSSDKKGATGL